MKYLILAGNRDQARHWAIEHGLKEGQVQYASCMASVMGLTSFVAVKTGDFWRHDDANKILDYVNFKILTGRAQWYSKPENTGAD